MRTVKTASGATAVQIVWSSRRGSRSIEHVGSAHDEAELAALKAAAAERLAAGQAVLDLGVAARRYGTVADHLLADEPSLGRAVCCLPDIGVRVSRQGRHRVS
ncbi:putative transposase [Mycobacterium xenopi 3993]|nr:putative transposase [Mycobacterium xenopi 3993]